MKKNSLKRLGTAGLAVATLASGLSFGAAAAPASATTTDASISAQGGRLVGVFVQHSAPLGNTAPFTSVAAPVEGQTPQRVIHPTEAAAAAVAATYNFPGLDAVGPIKGTGDASGLCLAAPSVVEHTMIVAEVCDGTARQDFKWIDVKNDHVSGPGLAPAAGSLPIGTTYADNGMFVTPMATGDTTQTVFLEETFGADVTSVDVAGRSAVLSGEGTPGATVIINDADEVTVGADGTWSWFLEGLKLGSNPVHLEQWERQGSGAPVKTAEADVDARLAFAGLSAAVEFDGDISKEAILSGQAEPGATVSVADAAGNEIASETAHQTTGRWSAMLTAPNQAGIVPFTVSQTITGELAETLMTSADYGTGVAITSPATGAAHDGGAITFSGTGLPGSTVELFDGDDKASTVKVLASGMWNKSLTLNSAEHVITAKQQSKGNNVTSSSVTLNPAAELGFEIVSPAAGSTVEAEPMATNPTSGLVTFTGTGAADSTVVVKTSAGGRVVGTAKTDNRGNWSLTGGLGFVTYTLEVTYTAPGQAPAISSHELTVAKPGTLAPFEVTTPADGSTVTADPMATNPTSALVEFTGRGNTDAVVQIKTATDGRIVGTTKVDANGNWTIRGGLGFVTYGLEVAYAPKGAATEYSTLNLTVKAPGVTLPFELSSPQSGSSVQGAENPSDVNSGLVEFTGNATTGTVVELINVDNGRVVGKATADNAGAWTFTGGFAYQTYPVGSLSLQYTVPGQAMVSSDYGITITR